MRFYQESKPLLERAENSLRRGPFTRSSGTVREMWKWAQGDKVRVGERNRKESNERQRFHTAWKRTGREE